MNLDQCVHDLLAKTAGSLALRTARNDEHARELVDGIKHYIRTDELPVLLTERSFEECLLSEAEQTIIPPGKISPDIYTYGWIGNIIAAGIAAGGDFIPGVLLGLSTAYVLGRKVTRFEEGYERPSAALKHLRENPQSFESYLRTAKPGMVAELRNFGHFA